MREVRWQTQSTLSEVAMAGGGETSGIPILTVPHIGSTKADVPCPLGVRVMEGHTDQRSGGVIDEE